MAGKYCKALFSVIGHDALPYAKTPPSTVGSSVGSELRCSRRCVVWWPDVKAWLVQSTHATCSVKATGKGQYHLLLPEPAQILYMFGFELIFMITHSETFYGWQCGWPLHSVMTLCGVETHSLRSSAQRVPDNCLDQSASSIFVVWEKKNLSWFCFLSWAFSLAHVPREARASHNCYYNVREHSRLQPVELADLR